jgi:predicted metalloprotease
VRFQGSGRDEDIQDRRGNPAPRAAAGLSLGGIAVVVVISLLLGKNPLELLGLLGQTNGSQPSANNGGQPSPGPRNPAEAQAERVVRSATTDIQDFWTQSLPAMSNGSAYRRTQLVLFADSTASSCGMAQAATGPFYCPGDQLVYIDLAFYAELSQRFGAPGQFAQAYVLAHEFGHRIQDILGIEARMRAGQRADPSQRNALSVAMELQADCFAGVWGASASQRGMLDAGEVEQGLTAAASIGDDRLQRMAGRTVSPERFTHGSSEQRVAWFRRGLTTGQISTCGTFGNGVLSP